MPEALARELRGVSKVHRRRVGHKTDVLISRHQRELPDLVGHICLGRGRQPAVELAGGSVVECTAVHTELPEVGVFVAWLVWRWWRWFGVPVDIRWLPPALHILLLHIHWLPPALHILLLHIRWLPSALHILLLHCRPFELWLCPAVLSLAPRHHQLVFLLLRPPGIRRRQQRRQEDLIELADLKRLKHSERITAKTL